jgi:hypothetical protein
MTRRDYFQILSAGTALAGAVQLASAAPAGDTDRERRMKWWHEARFGMFIHWGLYSSLGRHEWAMENRRRVSATRQDVQAATECRACLGEARQTGGPEIHGDDHQASRGFL